MGKFAIMIDFLDSEMSIYYLRFVDVLLMRYRCFVGTMEMKDKSIEIFTMEGNK